MKTIKQASSLVKSQMTHGDKIDELIKEVDSARGFLSEERLCDFIDKASRSIRGAVNDIKYRAIISEKKVHTKVSPLQLLGYVADEYKDYFDSFNINEDVLMRLMAIFSQNEELCNELGLDMGKGVLLYGGTGVGKTSVMKAIARVLSKMNNPNHPTFVTVSASKIASDYAIDGDETMRQYLSPVNRGLIRNGGYFIDDIGVDGGEKSHYKNTSNVIGDLIQTVYNVQEMKGKIHASTNLSANDIKELYGERVYSRFMEMFNVVKFPADSVDYRTK